MRASSVTLPHRCAVFSAWCVARRCPTRLTSKLRFSLSRLWYTSFLSSKSQNSGQYQPLLFVFDVLVPVLFFAHSNTSFILKYRDWIRFSKQPVVYISRREPQRENEIDVRGYTASGGGRCGRGRNCLDAKYHDSHLDGAVGPSDAGDRQFRLVRWAGCVRDLAGVVTPVELSL